MKVLKNQSDRKVFFKEHLEDMTYAEIAPIFGLKNGECVRSWAKRHSMPNKTINKQSKRTSKRNKNENLIDFIKSRGRTEKEIESLGFSFEEAKEIAEAESGYRVYTQRNEYNERVLALIKKIEDNIKIKPPAFKCSLQEDGQPYIWIQFPKLKKNKTVDKINIYPISDVHYGHIACDIETFLQDVEYVKNHDNVYTFLNGDIIENASKLSIASGVYEQNKMPDEQIFDIIKILAPIAHKILFYVSGNHEERVYKHLGVDVGRLIAEKLNVVYFNEPVYVDLMWRDYVWKLFSQHGASASRTKGGKMNAAARPITWLEYTHFIVYG